MSIDFNKYDRAINPDWEPDALVSLYMLTENEGGRNKPVFSGYRPQYKVLPNYQTSTCHFFLNEDDYYFPGRAEKAFIKFITPDAYPHCFKRNIEIDVCEGSRIVGRATILEIYNELLLDSGDERTNPNPLV